MALQITGGAHKGAKLAAPKGHMVRPSSARLREAVFDILKHGVDGFALEDARVIDLFAGTGALGLEALSRGAGYCLFVEQAMPARAALRQNIEKLGLGGCTKIFRRDATRLGAASPLAPFELALIDPPYGKTLGERALSALHEGGWLGTGAIAVLEEAARANVDIPDAFTVIDNRHHGEGQTLILRFSD